MKEEILRLEGVTTKENELIYLDNFHLWQAKGEILGLTATNQHGLEQLIAVITDNPLLEYGQVYFAGILVNDYIYAGKGPNPVSVIDHRSRLVPSLTVTDNIFVLRRGFKQYVIQDQVLEKQVQQTFLELNFLVPANALAESLTVFERCVTELIKAVMAGVKLIIIRDIAAMISYGDLQRFYQLLYYYQNQGISFLYISTHPKEAFKLCNRFVLYDRGRIIKVFYPEEMDDAHMNPFVEQIQKPVKDGVLANKTKVTPKQLSLPSLDEFPHDLFSDLLPGKCLTILDKNHTIRQDFIEILLKYGDKKKMMIIPEDPVHQFLFWEQSYLYNLCFQVDQKMNRVLIPEKIRRSIRKEWQHEIGGYMDFPDLYRLPINALYDLVYYRILLYHPKTVVLLKPFFGVDMCLQVKITDWIIRLKENRIAVVLLGCDEADSLAVADQAVLVEEGVSK